MDIYMYVYVRFFICMYGWIDNAYDYRNIPVCLYVGMYLCQQYEWMYTTIHADACPEIMQMNVFCM